MYPYNYANIFLHASIPSKVVDFNLRDKVLFGKKVLFSTSQVTMNMTGHP